MLPNNDSNLPEHQPIVRAQRLFLQKAVELKPELVDDLRTLANDTYLAFFVSLQLSQMKSTKGFIQMPIAITPKWNDLASNVNAMNLRRALLVWADRWNINAEWCLDYGLSLLDEDYRSQIKRNIFDEQEPYPAHGKQTERGMTFSETLRNSVLIGLLEALLNEHGDLPSPPQGWPEWNPIREKRQAYIQRVTRDVLKIIEANRYMSALPKVRKRGLISSVASIAQQYCKKIEERKKQANIQPIKLSRNIERNLLWSVKFQVAGMTYSALADEFIITQKPKSRQSAKRRVREGVHIATVKRSVEQTLKLLGLRKRPNSGPGRPLHAKDSQSAQIRRQLGVDS